MKTIYYVQRYNGNVIGLTQVLITVETNTLTKGFISYTSTVNYSLILCGMGRWRKCMLTELMLMCGP